MDETVQHYPNIQLLNMLTPSLYERPGTFQTVLVYHICRR